MGHIAQFRVKISHRRALTIRILWFIGGVYFLQSFYIATLSQVPDYIGTNYPFVRQMVIFTTNVIILYDINALRFVKSYCTEPYATEYI